MASLLEYFKKHYSSGRWLRHHILSCSMLCFLGRRLEPSNPAVAEKVFLINNSPILRMLLHEKILKASNEALEFAEPTTRTQGQNIQGLPEIKSPAEPISAVKEQEICELPQADEHASDSADSLFGTNAQEDESDEDNGRDDMSGSMSCYTQAAGILDKVLHGGNQPTFAEFAGINCELDSENPIPPEYEAGTECLRAALEQFPMPPFKVPSKADARREIHEDPPGFVPPPLTKENLKDCAQARSPSVPIPSRPCPFMKNPRHHDPRSMAHDKNDSPLECWDGCPDCEVYIAGMGSRLWKVHHWFEKYFTHHDMYQGDFGKNPSHPSLKYLEPDPDDEEGNIFLVKRDHDEDYLLGAEGDHDFPCYKLLWIHEPEDKHQDIVTLLVQYNQLGEEIDGGYYNLNYYYGERFNAILHEYEPRVLPNVGFDAENKLHVLRYPGIKDMSKPIWEARGCPWPMQIDSHTRMEYVKMEYNRKLLMYRAQDEARQRYVQQVREAARYEYIQKGLLEE